MNINFRKLLKEYQDSQGIPQQFFLAAKRDQIAHSVMQHLPKLLDEVDRKTMENSTLCSVNKALEHEAEQLREENEALKHWPVSAERMRMERKIKHLQNIIAVQKNNASRITDLEAVNKIQLEMNTRLEAALKDNWNIKERLIVRVKELTAALDRMTKERDEALAEVKRRETQELVRLVKHFTENEQDHVFTADTFKNGIEFMELSAKYHTFERPCENKQPVGDEQEQPITDEDRRRMAKVYHLQHPEIITLAISKDRLDRMIRDIRKKSAAAPDPCDACRKSGETRVCCWNNAVCPHYKAQQEG